MAHDVFISHSAKDKTTASAVCARIEVEGLRCWIAPRDILPGCDWGEAIVQAIKNCAIMVLIFSSHASTSVQIKREVERAVHNGKIIIPFRIEDVEPSGTLEYFISTSHWLEAFTPPLEKHIGHLLTTIQSFLEREEDSSGRDVLQNKVLFEAQQDSGKKGKRPLLFAVILMGVTAVILASYWMFLRGEPVDHGISETVPLSSSETAKLDPERTVNPSWNEVVDEAIRLRSAGRIGEAVASLSKYEQLFQEKDPSTKKYVKTAQAFTQQCNRLGVKGGAYIYEIVEGGNAAEGGIKLGDIIISYHGELIHSTKTFVESRAKIIPDEKIRVGFLRMEKTGHFEKKIILLPNGPLGVQLMDI